MFALEKVFGGQELLLRECVRANELAIIAQFEAAVDKESESEYHSDADVLECLDEVLVGNYLSVDGKKKIL